MFGRSFEENEKKFKTELKRVWKSGTRTKEPLMDMHEGIVKGDDARKRWAYHFEKQRQRQGCRCHCRELRIKVK